MDPRLKALAELIHAETLAELERRYPQSAAAGLLASDAEVEIVPGRVYTKIDVGRSGKYMVDQSGNIWGIKGYGVIHRGYRYGTLDTIRDWYWGGYVAVPRRKGQAE